MTGTDPRTPEELHREAQAQSDRAALVRSLRADVDAARRTHGEMPREESVRFWARRLGIPAPELSAAIGTWPACADD